MNTQLKWKTTALILTYSSKWLTIDLVVLIKLTHKVPKDHFANHNHTLLVEMVVLYKLEMLCQSAYGESMNINISEYTGSQSKRYQSILASV